MLPLLKIFRLSPSASANCVNVTAPYNLLYRAGGPVYADNTPSCGLQTSALTLPAFAVRSSDSVKAIADAVPTTEYAVPTTEYAVPTTEYAVPTTGNAVPIAEYAVPMTEYAVPTTGNAVPTTEYAVPMTGNAVPTTEYAVPMTEYAVPTTEYAVPETADDVFKAWDDAIIAAALYAAMIAPYVTVLNVTIDIQCTHSQFKKPPTK